MSSTVTANYERGRHLLGISQRGGEFDCYPIPTAYPVAMSKPLRILALEPYYGGSHKAFLDGWIANSRHDWTLLSLPATKWKWRMRHSAITMAGQVADAVGRGQGWDLLFCSDMLGLAEFVGMAPATVQALPRIVISTRINSPIPSNTNVSTTITSPFPI